jgi:diguanylate cyclase (GGDEF)-like protein/PAS domain S-box-containing protein
MRLPPEASDDPLKKVITSRYVLAVILMGVLATVSLSILFLALKGSEHNAFVVNISGKQRMLSQVLALDAHRYYQVISEQSDTFYRQNLRQSIQDNADEMLAANEQLSSGHFDSGYQLEISPTVHEMYFGQMKIYQRVKRYANLARSIATMTQPLQIAAALDRINVLSDDLLSDLNRLVDQYQLEGEQKLQFVTILEVIAWLVAIITLLLEVIFIFQPLQREVLKLSDEKSQFYAELERQILLKTERLQKANQQLSSLAMHDPLTGLKNRLTLERDLEMTLRQYHENKSPFAILMLDIDWFKKVNDNYGHDVGDVVLRQVAKILVSSVRQGDAVYRIGGEEFIIILNRLGYQDASHIAHKILRRFEQHEFDIDGHQFHSTLSGGLFHSSKLKLLSVKDALKAVDNALYESKQQGRNRITEVSERLHEAIMPSSPAFTRILFDGLSFDRPIKVDADILELLAVSREQLVAGEVALKSLVHPDDLDVFESIPAELANSARVVTTLRLLPRNGTVIIVRLEASHSGNQVQVLLQDSTRLVHAMDDDLLRLNFNAMMENTNDYIYFKDRHHVFTAASETLVALTSVESREDLIGKIDYQVFERAYADEYYKLEKQVFSGEVNVARELQPTLDNDGNQGWVDNRKYPVRNEQGEIIGLFGIARIISDIQNQAENGK